MELFYLIICCVLITAVWTYSIEDESKLQVKLLTDYNANVRPASRVDIKCGLVIRNIISLDIVEQTLAVTGSLVVLWDDGRLTWNESQHGNVSRVYFKSDQIWRPTLVLKNSAVGIEVLGDNGNQKSIPITVSSDGSVYWLAPAFFVSYCAVDVSKFPFDTQTCDINISGWLYSVDSIKLVNLGDFVSFNQFEENGEYHVIRTYTHVDAYKWHKSVLEDLIFGITVKRKYSYYLINVVLPVLFMQLLGVVVFWVPVESGEKLTFSLTLLLSLTVMMTLVAEKIPTTSLQIPYISIYMLGGTVISSLEVIMTVVILHFKHLPQKDGRQDGGPQEDGRMSKRCQVLIHALVCLTHWKRNKKKRKEDKTNVESAKQNGVKTTDNITKEDIGNNPEDSYNEIIWKNNQVYSYTDVASILDRFASFFFATITVLFTFAMAVLIL